MTLGSMSNFLCGFISLFRFDLISWDTKNNYRGAKNTLDINQHPPSRTASHFSSTNDCSLLDLFSNASSVGVIFCECPLDAQLTMEISDYPRLLYSRMSIWIMRPSHNSILGCDLNVIN